MGRHLFQGSYSLDDIKGVLKEGGTGRCEAVEDALLTPEEIGAAAKRTLSHRAPGR